MTTIELICVLHAIVAEPSIAARGEDQSLNWGYIDDRHALIQEAVDLAEQVLIDEEGERDIQAEVTLALAGFPVRCIERDRRGWLIGAIETEKGLITYG
jgi:hypothetical protein